MSHRTCRQLTAGPPAHFPLYYFVPSHTADGRFLVVHRQTGRDVQLCRIDPESGDSRQLTHGATPRSGWDNWCQPDTTGIYTHLSALNQPSNEVWWFESPADHPDLLQLRARNVATLEARDILELPGRLPIGQSAFSPDGTRFAFIHADHDHFRKTRAAYEPKGREDHQAWRRATPCVISLVDTETGERRDIADLDFHVHHVLFADNDHILVNHCPDGNGMWTLHVDENPEAMRILRPEDDAGRICHQVVTRRGIDYEVFQQFTGGHQNHVGRLEWPGGHWTEVPLDIPGYAHTGFDPEGRFCFYEVSSESGHALYALLHPLDGARREIVKLKDLTPYAGVGQRFHAHPFLGPDRDWMVFTDSVDGIPQVFALGVSDLSRRDDIGWPLKEDTTP